MKKTFASFSFGCRVNEAEREALDQQMLASGFSLNDKTPAICIINTCAVTAKAEREARQLIYRLRRDFPQAKIVITGCAATYWQKNCLNRQLPVDIIVDNVNKEYLVQLLNARLFSLSSRPTPPKAGAWRDPSTQFTLSEVEGLGMTGSKRLLVKIQDGCQRFCSYCIVPYLRGQPKSETIENILKKVRALHDRTEVVLTAINTEAFGYNTGEKLTNLLKTVIDKTTIPRVSLGSINPWSIDNNFYRFYRRYLPKKRLVNFFHIPLQSGSNKILALMKRGYTREEFSEKLNALHKINPLAFMATDLIVGFLDETDKDFQETYNFLKKSPISRFHVFRFSKRDNTVAYFMAKRLKEPSAAVKNERAKLLRELSVQKYNQFLMKLINYSSTALFIGKREGDYQEALLDNQVPVWIKTAKNLNGEIKNVKITGFKNGQLFGEIAL